MKHRTRDFLDKLKKGRKLLALSIFGILFAVSIPTVMILAASKKDAGQVPITNEPQKIAVNENVTAAPDTSMTADEKGNGETSAVTTAEEDNRWTEKADAQTNITNTNANTNSNTKPVVAPKPAEPTTAPAVSKPKPITYTYGNTSGNLTNGGTVVSDGQYVYYLNSRDGYKLYRSKPDGSAKVKISDSICHSLNVVGDWIFYSGGMTDSGIYKIKKDGSAKTLIVKAKTMGIAVVNDWIYYLERNASDSEESTLYKIKTDGTSKTEIKFGSDNSLACIELQAIVVVEDWVYLPLANKSEGKIHLYRVKTDGSIAQKVLNSSPRFFSIAEGWLYYSDETYKKLNKSKVDGSSERTIYTLFDPGFNLYSINVSNGYVYFSNDTDSQVTDKLGIYKMKTDGSELTQILSGSTKFLNIASDWIYFESPVSSAPHYSNGVYTVTIGGPWKILKLKTDGSQMIEVD